MPSRVDRVLVLASRVTELRAQLEKAEAELDGLLGGGGVRASAEPTPPTERPAAQGQRGGRHAPERDQILALSRDGLKPEAIAERLGWSGREGRIRVSNIIYRARQAGDLAPKAKAPQ